MVTLLSCSGRLAFVWYRTQCSHIHMYEYYTKAIYSIASMIACTIHVSVQCAIHLKHQGKREIIELNNL